eukprot:6294144-Pyramimonas_sp.AAC.1
MRDLLALRHARVLQRGQAQHGCRPQHQLRVIIFRWRRGAILLSREQALRPEQNGSGWAVREPLLRDLSLPLADRRTLFEAQHRRHSVDRSRLAFIPLRALVQRNQRRLQLLLVPHRRVHAPVVHHLHTETSAVPEGVDS